MRTYRMLFVGLFVVANCFLSTLATPAAARTAGVVAPSVPADVLTCVGTVGTATIDGVVLGPGGVGVKDVLAELYSLSRPYANSAWTNAAGAYTFTGVRDGSYLVRFNPKNATGGLLDEWYDNKADQASATPVVVGKGRGASCINATLAAGTQISGRVTASDSAAALQSVNVLVYDAAGKQVASGYTDVSGNYSTSPGLRTGIYRVYFASPIGKPYLAEYYADKADLATADLVVVTAPAAITGVDAVLAPAARISGRVTDATTGAGLPSISVAISNNDGYIDSDYTDANGYYTSTAGLASGSYEIVFRPVSDDSDYIEQRKSVTLTAPNLLAGVNAAMEKGGRITGRVTDSDGNPLKDITVFVRDETNGVYQKYVSTDAAGVYTAYGLPTTNYIVYFRPSQYLEEYYNDKPDRQAADRVAVIAPNTSSGIDAVLAKGGAILGRVTAADTGAGLDDVSIEIYDISGDRVETANTTATGYYTTSTTLRAGSYRVKFTPKDSGVAFGYTPQFYNNKAAFAVADVVTIIPPNTATNIDAALQPGSSIGGLVTDAGGAAIESGYVQVYDSAGERVAYGRTNLAGSYVTSPALPTGTYRIGFFPSSVDPGRYLDEYYNDKTALALSDPINVTAPDGITGINAVLAQGGAISGRVTAADTGAGLSNVSVSVYNAAGEPFAYGYTDASGAYTSSALPSGTYRVRFEPQGSGGGNLTKTTSALPSGTDRVRSGQQSSEGGYLSEYSGDAATLEAAAAVVVTAPNVTPIDAVLAKGATISGRVTAADTGTALKDVSVTVYDSSGEEVAFASTKADGSYNTDNGLHPGAYRLQFRSDNSASSYAMEFYNDKARLAEADAVLVTTTNVTGIDAALAKGSRISGTVTDAATSGGLPGIQIAVYASDGNQVAEGYTGPTGGYVTEPALASGSYRVGFKPYDYGQLGDYIGEFYNDKPTLAAAEALQLTAPTNRTAVDAALAKGGQITGQVFTGAATNAAGTAGQPGVAVTVYNSAGLAVATGKTNGLGMYTTQPGLPNGSYRISFAPPNSMGYQPTFYRGKLTLATADPVEISAPGTRSGINDTVLPVRATFLPLTLR